MTLNQIFLARLKKISYFCIVIELARHIEVLLLTNDCVAVPGFGGFVAHYVSAHVDEADGLFLPPQRTIGFNPQLKMNDSLLVQSYVEAYDISYPEALRRIEQETDEIERKILEEGFCVLDGIGTLTRNDEGNYNFTPYEAGLLTPSLYGLYSFEFGLLNGVKHTDSKSVTVKQNNEEKAEPVVLETTEEEESHDPSLIELIDSDEEDAAEHAIHIKMSWIRNTVAIAAAIVLFFLLTTPVANSSLNTPSMSALQHIVVGKLIPKDSNMAPATPVVEQKDAVAKQEVKPDTTIAKPVLPDEKPVVAEKATDTENPYCIVLASQVKHSNAEIFAGKMRDRGFKDTEIHVYKGVVRVVYGHFKSEGDAYAELHRLRFEEDFEEAWVYKRRAEG